MKAELPRVEESCQSSVRCTILLGSWHLLSCQLRACCRACVSSNMAGDEVISNADCIVWQGWINELACLRTISVPRCFKPSGFGTVVNVQLHHFSDVSEYGYGAVSYLRIVDDKGVIYCSFILGKSRVTPLKVVSIPRLELTAAVVAVKLNCLIRNEIE